MATSTGRIIKIALTMFVILIVSSIVFSLSGVYREYSLTPYSITSNAKNGLSQLKEMLEQQGYEIKMIVTDPESITSVRRNVVYTIIGATLSYDMQSAFTILSLLQNGSSILIVDDFGRANTLLEFFWSAFPPNELARTILGMNLGENVSVEELSIYFNESAVVMDAESYWRNPAYVVVKNFNDYYGILSGTLRGVLTKFAAAISVDITFKYKENGTTKKYVTPLPSRIGFMVTSPFSWLETDIDSIAEGKATPDIDEWGGVPFSIAIVIEVPNGGRIAIIGDPDIFTNDVIEISRKEGFDNERFIIDLFNWLAEPTGSKVVVFDESRKAITPDNPLFGLALTMKVITSFIRYWIIAPVIPLIFILFFVYYLPRRFRTKVMIFKPSVKKAGTSPYYGRYLWYMYRGGYVEAFKVIMDNLRSCLLYTSPSPRDRG